jgi:hypothetical protein
MFIRWQAHRTRDRIRRTERIRWAVILVESKRIDGKPRQRHVAYLGSFDDSYLERICVRGFFLKKVADRLDRLGNRISPDARSRIDAAIAKRLPPLTPEQYQECERGLAAFRSQAIAIVASMPRRRRRKRLNDDA